MNARRFLRDDSGIAAIEFAAVLMIAVVLIVGTIELALEMIVDATVQVAAQEASRVGLTTTSPASGTRQQQALAIVNKILSGWTKIGANVVVTESNYGTFGNLANASYTPTSDMGAYGDVVVYNIKLTMQGITGIPKMFGVNELTFQRNYIVQNEK
ncbi:TadE/TadG family type IV pilus assembly protein [Caballeronia sp. ATUFL_M2_KS44]|uniref:TadE/TadG family type IV pilus assembly protein n=1 Tax=Caballeronia sp. ATUFL_M2_KS44 TaxID=2921767 RepID=UPI0020280BDA|nr:TadE/TadG family type IV pilus assembly protein [Caballeronia sp. ATUFL_M2_KS44]